MVLGEMIIEGNSKDLNTPKLNHFIFLSEKISIELATVIDNITHTVQLWGSIVDRMYHF